MNIGLTVPSTNLKSLKRQVPSAAITFPYLQLLSENQNLLKLASKFKLEY